MASYDILRIHRYVTSAALGNIQKFTDPEDYELIFVDANPSTKDFMNYKYHLIKIDKYIDLETDPGISACRNIGAKHADPDNGYICFIDNDVFVNEGWLDTLKKVMKKHNARYVLPQQGQTTREFIKKSYIEEHPGQDDAGLMLMTREAFDITGGWDERFGSVYHELGFRKKLGQHHIHGVNTNQTVMTHISGITTFDSPKFDEWYAKEGAEINKPS